MRILQIRLKNLNSLVGEWTIDLTHPAYGADGLFAITGPTGSGKSTILDAICLALYGRTPRLERVNKSENEILSRQTGECFAEVTFETQSGRYRCIWSQRRARKKPDGDLQNPKHELADAESGAIVAEKVRGVAEQIEAVTGMDFDRFTRSMLLAQGDFAAFLQAAPDERSPILEQITGTRIYSEISIQTHRRTREQIHALQEMEIALKGLTPLTEEEERILQSELKQKQTEDHARRDTLQQTRAAIAWLDAMASLNNELRDLETQWDDHQRTLAAFEPHRRHLDRAVTALALDGGFARLTESRSRQEADQKALDAARQEAPKREKAAHEADATLKTAQHWRQTLRETQAQESAIQKKVRQWDLELGAMNQRLQGLTNEMDAQEQARQKTSQAKSDHEQRLARTRTEMETVAAYLRDHAADGALVEKLAGLRQIGKTLNETLQACRDNEEGLRRAISQCATAREQREASAEAVETAGHAVREARETLSRLSAEQQDLLQGREPADWRQILSDSRDRKTAIARLAESLETLERLRREREEASADQSRQASERAALENAARLQGQEQDARRRDVEHLQHRAELESRIRDLEEERARLEAGQPCPLCGATEHPFAQPDAVPHPDTTEVALRKARSDRDAADEALRKSQIALAEIGKEMEHAQHREKRLTGEMEQAREQCATIAGDLGLDPAGRRLAETIATLREQTDSHIREASAVIEKFDQLEKDHRAAQAALDQARDGLTRAERSHDSARHEGDKWEAECRRLESAQQEQAQRRDALLAEATTETQAYGVATLTPETFGPALEMLTDRRDAWQEHQERRGGCERRIETLTLQIENLSETLQQQDRDLAEKRDALLALTRERDAMAHERQTLYGDKDPDAEEARLARDLSAAETREEQARTDQAQSHKDLTTIQSDIARLEAAIAQRLAALVEAETAFAAALQDKGFADEADYRAASLDDDARRALTEEQERLTRKGTELATHRQDRQNRLKALQAQALTDRTRDDLASEADGQDAAIRQQQGDIGAIQQRLKDNADLIARRRERLEAIEAQRRECARWDALNQLIGSSDGKKYRNFVQGLTFEIMIGHANRQLRQMTDRYLLMRNDQAPLELNVVDHYQASEIRSTKNLSGGESFLVSLALALGLSRMASRNVRIDSLFLDEGFGTLDEDALETALQTLASLQQDGKLIGVISHVAALKERISARIQVQPQSGGHSALRGPGCAAARI